MATTQTQNGVRDEDSLRFFHVLSSRDPNTRKHGFDMIKMTLDAWANGYGSPKDQIFVGNGNPLPINPLVEEHLPDILRLSTNCPFEDVREWCSNLLADIQENCSGIKIPRRAHGKGPSKYIPESEVHSILSSLITIVQGKDCKKRNTHPPPPPTPPPTPKKGNKLRAQHREMKEGA